MTVSGEQDRVIEFLSRPESYGLQGATIERVETHCSIVFLAGELAYKLKRAIRYASLDYRTIAARNAACTAEVVLNRRTAPDLYLGVRSITLDPAGRPTFGGGAALDYVVVMRRFAQSDLFDRMAEQDLLTPSLMSRLGEVVAAFHAAAERTPGFGGSAAIRRVIADNARELARVADMLDGVAVATLTARTREALAVLAPLLDQRRQAGKVRRCHGDLRLANICLWAGQPTPFDCIEFSEEIGCIDVLYDLAFLLMDLELRGRRDLAEATFAAYLRSAPETAGLPAMPLFLSLRAATRAYALAGAAGRRADPAEASRVRTLAGRHVRAALGFLAAEVSAPAGPLNLPVLDDRV